MHPSCRIAMRKKVKHNALRLFHDIYLFKDKDGKHLTVNTYKSNNGTIHTLHPKTTLNSQEAARIPIVRK